MFSKKATKIDEIFTVYLTLCSKCQIDGEDLVNFCGLLKTRTLTNYIFGIKFGKKREISTGLSTYIDSLRFCFDVCVSHNKLRWLHLLSHIVKNLSIKTDASGGLVLIILKSDANLRATFLNCF